MNMTSRNDLARKLLRRAKELANPAFLPWMSEDRRRVRIMVLRAEAAALKEGVRIPHSHPPTRRPGEF
jgi:hypothetical protein